MKILCEKIIYTNNYAGRVDIITGIDDFNVDIEFDESKHQYKKNGVIIPSVTQLLHNGLYDFAQFTPEFNNAVNTGISVHKEIEEYLTYGVVGKSKSFKKFKIFFDKNKKIFEQKAIFDIKTYSKCDKRKRESCFKQISMYSRGIKYITNEIIQKAYMIWIPNDGSLKLIDLSKEFGDCISINKYNGKEISWEIGNFFYINNKKYISIGIPNTLVSIEYPDCSNWSDSLKIVREYEPMFNSRNITTAESEIYDKYVVDNNLDNSYLNDYWLNSKFSSFCYTGEFNENVDHYIKPVIFVKSDYQMDGCGTESDPYTVDYNYITELKFIEDREIFKQKFLKIQKKNKKKRKVYKCKNNGNIIEEYMSARKASLETGLSYNTICKSLSRRQRFGGAYVWVYSDEYDKLKETLFNTTTADLIPSQNFPKAILMLDDKLKILREFTSIKEAARFVGVNPSSIRNAARGLQQHAGGYRWKIKESERS